MKRILAAALITSSLASPAMATENWYGGLFGLVGFTDQDGYERTPTTALPVTGATDTGGVSGGGGLWGGYDFGDYRIEAASTYRARHDGNFSFTDITTNNPFGAKANVQTLDFMLSGLYDIPLGWKLQPYIGAGAGMVYSNLDTELLTATITDAGTSSDWQFAWQLQGGFSYPATDTMDVRLDYRYVDLGRIETPALPTGTADKLSADLTSHDVRIGVAWKF